MLGTLSVVDLRLFERDQSISQIASDKAAVGYTAAVARLLAIRKLKTKT